jgi:hypothetical protein
VNDAASPSITRDIVVPHGGWHPTNDTLIKDAGIPLYGNVQIVSLVPRYIESHPDYRPPENYNIGLDIQIDERGGYTICREGSGEYWGKSLEDRNAIARASGHPGDVVNVPISSVLGIPVRASAAPAVQGPSRQVHDAAADAEAPRVPPIGEDIDGRAMGVSGAPRRTDDDSSTDDPVGTESAKKAVVPD